MGHKWPLFVDKFTPINYRRIDLAPSTFIGPGNSPWSIYLSYSSVGSIIILNFIIGLKKVLYSI